MLCKVLSDLTLSTAFSGIAAPENTLSIMSRAVEHFRELKRGSGAPRTLFVVELRTECQYELDMLEHPADCSFVDMTDCIKENVKATLRQHAKRMSWNDIVRIVQSRRMVTRMMWCRKHQCKCEAKRASIHVAGTPCQAWSRQGSRQGCSGETHLPFAAWVSQRLLWAEDYILHENARLQLGNIAKVL